MSQPAAITNQPFTANLAMHRASRSTDYPLTAAPNHLWKASPPSESPAGPRVSMPTHFCFAQAIFVKSSLKGLTMFLPLLAFTIVSAGAIKFGAMSVKVSVLTLGNR